MHSIPEILWRGEYNNQIQKIEKIKNFPQDS